MDHARIDVLASTIRQERQRDLAYRDMLRAAGANAPYRLSPGETVAAGLGRVMIRTGCWLERVAAHREPTTMSGPCQRHAN